MSDEAPFCVAAEPHVSLFGPLEMAWVASLSDQLAQVGLADPVVIEVMTEGGDAEAGRRLALEISLARRRLKRRLVFLGKTMVYSAGVTMMSGFPVADRFLTGDCQLLIHCRQMTRTVELDGTLGACRHKIELVLSEIETGEALQSDGYRALIEGSSVSFAEIEERASGAWSLDANEALARGLVAGVI